MKPMLRYISSAIPAFADSALPSRRALSASRRMSVARTTAAMLATALGVGACASADYRPVVDMRGIPRRRTIVTLPNASRRRAPPATTPTKPRMPALAPPPVALAAPCSARSAAPLCWARASERSPGWLAPADMRRPRPRSAKSISSRIACAPAATPFSARSVSFMARQPRAESGQAVELRKRRPKQSLVLLLCCSVVMGGAQAGCAYETDQPLSGANQRMAGIAPPGTPPAPEQPQQLDQLVAPIALYPDALIAQILAASTYPAEIVETERWMQAHSSLKGDPLAQEVDKQPWDSSVKALTQFPAVLANMDKNLSWTSALGDAYENQPQDVLNAVQVMRQRAQQAGNLKSTAQETVATEGQTIVIQPASPDVVYVPEYDPWLVYGAPLVEYPGWVPAERRT